MIGLGLLLLAIGLIVTIAGIVLDNTAIPFMGGLLCGAALFILLTDDNRPTALDVYKGSTTLEITYRDSIAVDSVVVFKK